MSLPKSYITIIRGVRPDETRQQFVNYHVARLQRAVVADGGDKARQFVMLINTMREFGELYDRGVRIRSYPRVAA